MDFRKVVRADVLKDAFTDVRKDVLTDVRKDDRTQSFNNKTIRSQPAR